MLNYLRDPNSQEIPAEIQANNTPNTPQKEQEYLTVAAHKKAVRKSTTMLGVVFIIGLICLGVMIKKSAPRAASAKTDNIEEVQIETAIAKLTGLRMEVFGKMDEIVSKFYEFSDVFQVQVSELVKNPFQLESFVDTLKKESNSGDSAINADMIWREGIKNKAKGMKLYSIMQSAKGICCMIDNKILYEGDEIGDFMVKKINTDDVQIEMEDVEITIKLPK
jgi:hypothetical protein